MDAACEAALARIRNLDMFRGDDGIPSLHPGTSPALPIQYLLPRSPILIPHTKAILSTHPSPTPRLLQPKTFIPLGFLFFNAGDLLGRLLTLLQPSTPTFQTLTHPRSLALLALLRILFIPLYFLCNIRGRGAAVRSDLFYLGLVQLGFGLSNGWLGSTCMMSVGRWVGPEEREVAGGFMGMMLVVGLAVGSLASFAVRL